MENNHSPVTDEAACQVKDDDHCLSGEYTEAQIKIITLRFIQGHKVLKDISVAQSENSPDLKLIKYLRLKL